MIDRRSKMEVDPIIQLKLNLLTLVRPAELRPTLEHLIDSLVQFHDNLMRNPYPTNLAAMEDLQECLEKGLRKPPLNWKVTVGTWLLNIKVIFGDHKDFSQLYLLELIQKTVTLLNLHT